MKIHPREKLVSEAERKLDEVLLEIRKSDLTEYEFLQVVIGTTSEFLLRMTKYQIRYERHGNTDKPGGIA